MSFLTPWFLLGTLAVAGPILFHLIRRSARERMPFSSLLFLSPTPPRVARRRKLEHLWLLLLRCLVLSLLATAFARPFFNRITPSPPPATEWRQRILLLDTSASMRRPGLWDKALTLAATYLADVSPADQVAVLTFDRQLRTRVSFAEWETWTAEHRGTLARQRLAAVSPGWMDTHLGRALTGAAEQFADDPAGGQPPNRREMVLITDLQEGSKLDGLQGHEWPSHTRVIVERVDAREPSNAGLEIVDSSGATAAAENEVRVRVVNSTESTRDKFRLGWSAESGTGSGTIEIYLPPGQTKTLTAPKIPAGMKTGTLLLTGDAADFDNAAYVVAPEVERVTVAYFGSESANDPAQLRYYLQRAFPETPWRRVEFKTPAGNAASDDGFLSQAAFAVIPAGLASNQSAALRAWLAGGQTALMILTDAQMGSTLAALAGLPDIQMVEAGGGYALLGEIDFTHPLFAPFADPRFSDFAHIHFWKHRRFEMPPNTRARALARFDDGSPALAQIAVGNGNLLVLAAGWNPADSQLAVSSKFLPLMQTMLDWSCGTALRRSQFRTGDPIPSPVASGADVRWDKPDGTRQTLAAGAPFLETDLPGVYVASSGGKERRFAVNLPLDESRTTPLAPDELARLGVPLQTPAGFSPVQTQQRQLRLQQAELENRQKIWRQLIVAALTVTLGEIILSGWLARSVKTVGVAP